MCVVHITSKTCWARLRQESNDLNKHQKYQIKSVEHFDVYEWYISLLFNPVQYFAGYTCNMLIPKMKIMQNAATLAVTGSVRLF